MEITRHWRLKAQRYRMEGSICSICGQPIFPPRPVCPHCTVEPEPIADYGLSVIPVSDRTVDSNLLKGS